MIPLGILASGKKAVTFWISRLFATQAVVTRYQAEKNNKIYVAGQDALRFVQQVFSFRTNLVQLNLNGERQWVRSYGSPSRTSVESAGGLVAMTGVNSGQIALFALIANSELAIYNENGNFVSSHGFAGVTTRALTTDNAAGLYFSGSNNNDLSVVKLDSSNSISFQRRLTQSSTFPTGNAVAIDSSGSIYVAGTMNSRIVFAKWNSSGTIQFQRLGGANNSTLTGMAIASNNDVYLCGRDFSGSTPYLIIIKLNSSGTILWQRRIQLQSNPQRNDFSVQLDSEENVYVCGQNGNEVTSRQDLLLAKYNSSGVIQWQRRVGHPTVSLQISKMQVLSEDTISLTFDYVASQNTSSIVFKVPTDGSKTGTYSIDNLTSFSYITGTLTESAGATILSASSYSASNGVVTTQSVAGQNLSVSLSNTVVPI